MTTIKAFEGISDGVVRSCFVRAFVTVSKPLQKERSEEKVEETCERVSEAAGAVKKGATQVTNMTKDVRGKVSEATESITKRARDNVVDVAGQKLKEKVIDENK